MSSMDESCSTSRPLGYPSDETTSSSTTHNKDMVSNATSYSYSRFGDIYKDVFSNQEIGWDHGDFSPKENRPYMIRWKSGKKVDQRLLILLESYFQELYVKRNEFFKKIFPDQLYDEFVEVFKKIGAMLSKNNNESKYQTMQRSLSLGSSETRLDWFNVQTPNVVVVQPVGGGQGGDDGGTTSNVSPK